MFKHLSSRLDYSTRISYCNFCLMTRTLEIIVPESLKFQCDNVCRPWEDLFSSKRDAPSQDVDSNWGECWPCKGRHEFHWRNSMKLRILQFTERQKSPVEFVLSCSSPVFLVALKVREVKLHVCRIGDIAQGHGFMGWENLKGANPQSEKSPWLYPVELSLFCVGIIAAN